ncbi:MAG TPA: SGNH/GDSL hydrolase family protein [Lentimicrobium sp.]|nr:SGNH/GDSL hydrolase family protein [Lentimicrobium sp.]
MKVKYIYNLNDKSTGILMKMKRKLWSLFALALLWVNGSAVAQDWAQLERYAKANKEMAPKTPGMKRIVFMGNSITEGWSEKDSIFFKKNAYVNRGISGQTTPQMLIRFRPDVIDIDADVVVILAGINDIAHNTGPAKISEIYGNIVSMVELARANKIKVVMCTVLPAHDFYWRPGLQPAEKIVELNLLLKDYAAKNSIPFVDYYSAMVNEKMGLKEEYTEDGVHPTLAGYKVMEPLVEAKIRQAIAAK